MSNTPKIMPKLIEALKSGNKLHPDNGASLLNCHRKSVRMLLLSLHADGKVYIAKWDARLGPPVAVFAWKFGDEQDVPRPALAPKDEWRKTKYKEWARERRLREKETIEQNKEAAAQAQYGVVKIGLWGM